MGLTHRVITVVGTEVWLVNDLSVHAGAEVEFVGARPLLIAALGSMLIEGSVTASSLSAQTGDGPLGGDFVTGAGAQAGCTGGAGLGDATGGA